MDHQIPERPSDAAEILKFFRSLLLVFGGPQRRRLGKPYTLGDPDCSHAHPLSGRLSESATLQAWPEASKKSIRNPTSN